ncbi:MAG: nucleotidyl transferase AbiEii/AbiGii toxin family protein [Candidatus Yanofskybacteria bacterium]|nr:nucleotidyl transferase AbiEii/AbiGii toxin family protein [Candidatus Yanofskybacteria bacterium]
MNIFYNILDKERIELLPVLRVFKNGFYLAGGTALALQIGHRDSMDFDFFKEGDIDTGEVFVSVTKAFNGREILKVQEDKNTLAVVIDDKIKLSFFDYGYKLIDEVVDEGNLILASVADIGCMKLSSITGRASNKDYIDLYFILKIIKLDDLLAKASVKLPDLDKNLILKSLVYFDDINVEPIMFKNNNEIGLDDIKIFMKKTVRELVGL